MVCMSGMHFALFDLPPKLPVLVDKEVLIVALVVRFTWSVATTETVKDSPFIT